MLTSVYIRKPSEYEPSEKHPYRVDTLRVWIPVLCDREVTDDVRKYGYEYTDPEYIEKCGRKNEWKLGFRWCHRF